jgi:hypothetical protein
LLLWEAVPPFPFPWSSQGIATLSWPVYILWSSVALTGTALSQVIEKHAVGVGTETWMETACLQFKAVPGHPNKVRRQSSCVGVVQGLYSQSGAVEGRGLAVPLC